MRAHALVCSGLLLGALGCAQGVGEQGSARQAIIDGEASPSAEDGVLMLRAELADGTEALCSGSLVAPNLVLTARHCVSHLTPGLFNCTVRGELIDNPDDGGRLGLHLSPESVEVYGRETPRSAPLARGQRIVSTLTPSICVNDLAFLVLDTQLELPLLPLRRGRPAQRGEAAALVGYGLSGGQRVLAYRTQPRLRKPGITVSDIGPDALEDGVTTAPPRSLLISGPSGCIGDSGGPLLAESSGAVLGVYSLLAGGSCEEEDVRHQLVHVPPFEALQDEAFAAAGATPLLEPEPEPEPEPGPSGQAGEPGDFTKPAESDGSCALGPAPSGGAWALPALLLALGAGRRRR